MTDWVRYRLPWNWEDLDEDARKQNLRDLAAWVTWFVARYHLVRRIPSCWYQHPGLVDEVKSLRYCHDEVTNPLVALVQPDLVGDPMEPEDPEVAARMYQDWHEARWRWMTGPLAEAAGYRECLAQQEHVDDGHGAVAACDHTAHAEPPSPASGNRRTRGVTPMGAPRREAA